MKYSLVPLVSLAGIAWLNFVPSLPAAEKQPVMMTTRPTANSEAKADPKAVDEATIPRSVFEVSNNPRNPFFPASRPAPGPIIPDNQQKKPQPVELVTLNGLSGPPVRTAIINGRTFEAGEEAEVRLRSGSKLLVKCLEIGDDSATVLVAGQRRVLKLRAD